MAENIQNLKDTTKGKEHEIDLKEVLFRFLGHWKWFVISIILCLAYGAFKIYRSIPMFKAQELVMIKDSRNGSDEFLLDLAGMGRSNMANEIATLTSPDLCAKVVTALELYTTYRIQGKFGMRERELYKSESPIYVRLENVSPDSIYAAFLEFVPADDHFEIEINKSGKIYSVKINDMPIQLETPYGVFYIDMRKGAEMPERNILVSINNPKALSWMYAGSLSITETDENSTLLNISGGGEHPQKCIDFIVKLIDVYNDETTDDKNTVARNTSGFILERIKEISAELDDVEQQAESFRQSHQITDINSAANLYFQRSGQNEQDRLQLETQLNLISFVETFVLNPDNKNKLIPNLSLADVSITGLIGRYNEVLLNRERLVKATSESNPALIQMNEQIESMRQGIITAISNVKHTAMISKQNLERQNVINNARVQTVPALDRQYSEITRQQKVKEDLYIYLLKKREETALAQAAISPKAKIVTAPAFAMQTAPNTSTTMMYSLVAGILIPIILIILRDFFRTNLESREDLTKLLKAPFIGEISKNVNDDTTVIVKKNVNSSIVELFRALRNSLNFIIGKSEKKVIMITSTLAGEGKTFISINLAMSYALMDNKKVILLGLDIRNPKLAQNLGLKKTPGITSYLSGVEEDYSALITGTTFHENLFLLQAGSIPPNPNELLASEKLDVLMGHLRQEYDIIIVDTAPVGLVSDTFLLNRIADVFIYVTRENVTPKQTLEFINNLYEDNRLNNMYVVLNDTDLKKKKYGYAKYKYGYKYHYGYHSDKK
ncbi:MAG: polysaccharide biosynthesis tyrosine autokinase [Candidatus Azobacteroides sp.]|nr:polysaccharide biosynthesis tyrosine autokinase [Candidatus Azobacteroides sp.]